MYQLIDTIRQAARQRKTIIIEYRPKDGGMPEKREVEPYSFRPEGTTDRLMAWDVNKDGIRSFLTENILSIRIGERSFVEKHPVEL